MTSDTTVDVKLFHCTRGWHCHYPLSLSVCTRRWTHRTRKDRRSK